MNVLDFPITDQATLPVFELETDAVIMPLVPRETTTDPLHEILRKAVVSYRASAARTSGSFASRHHLAISHAYLDAAAILAGNPGSAGELAQCLDVDIFDIKKLAAIARSYEGPFHA